MINQENGGPTVHRRFILLVGSVFVLWFTGCTDNSPPSAITTANATPPPAIPTNPNVVPAVTAPSETPAPATPPDAAKGPDKSPAVAAPPQKPDVPAPAPDTRVGRIRLSAGVALPQSLPQGTTVMCSMDYEWVEGSPQQGCEYSWVVELGNGKPVAGPAKVNRRRGTIEIILNGIKPDQGPFKGAIFVKTPGANPEPISDFVNLK
jgi:hypothetical protein